MFLFPHFRNAIHLLPSHSSAPFRRRQCSPGCFRRDRPLRKRLSAAHTPRADVRANRQCWVAGGHHFGTNSPDPKQVLSQEAMVMPGSHREPVSAWLALLAPAGVEGESQLSASRASLPCRGVLCHMGSDFPYTGPTDQHKRTINELSFPAVFLSISQHPKFCMHLGQPR